MWQSFYENVGNHFGIPGRYYGPDGHRGADITAKADAPIPAYEGGTVVNIQFSAILGTCMVVEMRDGRFAGYAHMKRNPPVVLRQEIFAGQTIGYVAGPADRPGSSWTGPHLHTTIGYTVTAIFFGPVYDPLPRIVAATHPTVRPPAKPSKPAALINRVLRRWHFWLPPAAVQLRIQRALKKRHRYAGRFDGKWGKLSIKGIQLTLRNVGYKGLIDGVPGKLTCYYVQVYAKKFGGYTGKTDSLLGINSWIGFARGLDAP